MSNIKAVLDAVRSGKEITTLMLKAAEEELAASDLTIGSHVEKVGGDYTFVGWVVAVFHKRSGAIRYVVEDDRGVLHVYSRKNLRTI